MSKRALFVGGCPHSFHRLEESAPPVTAALKAIGFEVNVSGVYHPDGGNDFTGDYAALSDANLRTASVVVLHTTGNERREGDLQALKEYVQAGGALVGIHCATDSFKDDPEYIAMIGGSFRTHPAQLDIQTEFVDHTHPITAGLNDFKVHDELYLFDNYLPENVHLLAQTRSFDDNGPVPIAWVKEVGKGRVFYLSLGHNGSTMADANWQKLFQNGVLWSVGALD